MKIHYGFSLRSNGDMRKSENIHAFLSSVGLRTEDLVTAEQVHGTTVQWVDDNTRGRQIPKTDALVYQVLRLSQSCILGVRSADCVPVLLFDSKRHIISAIHSGWKGTLGGIVTNVIQSMIERGSNVSDIRCVIGPHIRSCCYRVSPERADRFIHRYGTTSVIYKQSDHFLDLTFAVRSQLLSFNIGHSHIIDQGMCTACNVQQYYSFRAETKETFGEMLGYIAISG